LLKLGEKILVFDGAMGTMLQRAGLKLGEIPEVINFTEKDIVKDIHKKYILSGADIITTNTFGANEYKIKNAGYTVEEIIDQAILNAKEAAENTDTLVALDIGPIGELLEPLGTLSFDDAYNMFKKQAVQGEKSGADLVIIETMTDLNELRAAILAIKENTSLPVIATMTFEETGRTFTGCLAQSFAITVSGMGVDAVGVNCSLGPKELMPIVKTICENTQLPVIVQANAGLPTVKDGKTVYNITKEEFLKYVTEFVDMGVSVVGGCCGTDPSYIKLLADNLKSKTPVKRNYIKKCRVCTPSEIVEIDKVRVIGERINPTGKKLFKEALLNGDMDYILGQAISQVEAGADILDVNVGLPGIDEAETMVKIIKEISKVTNTPLQIDSSNKEAVEKGLRYYPGKAIVNSVNGEDSVLDSVLPLVKKYGAAVVGLTMSDNGIPEKAEERVRIAGHIIEKALSYGIDREDIYIDCLTLTASAQQEAVMETLKALKDVKEKYNVKTVLGVSNISFGLPNRNLINETFLSMALSYGLDLPIINPNAEGMMNVISAYNVLSAVDKNANEYILKHSDSVKEEIKETTMDLKQIIIQGLKEKAKSAALKLMETEKPFDIVDKYLIPALDIVGKKYEKGEAFLPQLIQSAEAVKCCVEAIKEITKTEEKLSKGKIIIATVKGDVHDIGKNIVKIILENYGYEIIDLGKDVKTKDVLEAIEKYNVKLIGLSALMTTTVVSMEETIREINKKYPDVRVMVGGAVLTLEYAEKIGADYYGKDAGAAVEIAKKIIG